MKFLPLKFREKQTDWFGQRGKNWHVTVCIYRDAQDTICHRTFTHVFDGGKQDWFSVISIIENVFNTIKDQLPQLTEVFLRSDNAACYHCGHMWLCLPEVSKRTGLNVKTYCYSEPQAGKSYCDSKNAHMKRKMRTWVTEGNDIVTATDMKSAIDATTGVTGCQVAVVTMDTDKQIVKSHRLKQINCFNEVVFQDNGILLRKAYAIGDGKFISNDELLKAGNGLQMSQQSGCKTLEGFTLPTVCEGKISRPQPTQTDLDTVYCCPEPGCTNTFPCYRDAEDHLALGTHNCQLVKESTYDNIKRQWARLCNEVVITYKVRTTTGSCTSQADGSRQMGWALRSARKGVRFNTKVKDFLQAKFMEGERNKKSDPLEVSYIMKTLRDDEGNKMFSHSEWLRPNQITSFFSRLSNKKIKRKTEAIDDEDLFVVLDAIDNDVLLNELSES
ncbi:uncharacterized protein LOC124278361 [Haliotis rubra]|uniref:uncharacterized protein LOC124278361 n=1 Tax=Haliotis rubra TaxID=36100 RepID=UPI001EE5D932|nr:uncharacterized protein LOC124278361 [Haliotis rubra]